MLYVFLLIKNKRMIFLVAINKNEKEIIMRVFPGLHVARTMRNDSKRHHYYMEEAPGAVSLLRSIRGENRNPKNRAH